MPFTIQRRDITRLQVDAIVNAANTGLRMGGGVCGAIFQAAGPEKLQKACDKLAPISVGEAALTPGFDLPARYVIHAAGPVYHQYPPEESRRLLYAAYASSLQLAAKHRCKSIAFPLISSGIYGYPREEALQVAVQAIRDFLREQEMDVILTVFDRASFSVSRKLMGPVESYVSQHYVDENLILRKEQTMAPTFSQSIESAFLSNAWDMEADMTPPPPQPAPPEAPHREQAARPFAAQPMAGGIDELIVKLDKPFSDYLLDLIDSKGKKDVEVYKRANIDRKLFSKIRSGKGYTPRKPTILALAVALELDLSETSELLKRAGYALSHASKFDVIVEYFILNRQYDIFEINQVLFEYDLPLLGAGI